MLRASSADEYGNLSFEDEPITSSALAMALAVKACGGTVIAQVRKIVPRQARPVHAVRVPGELVDRVVVAPQAMMTTEVVYDDSYLGGSSFLVPPRQYCRPVPTRLSPGGRLARFVRACRASLASAHLPISRA